MYNNFGGFAGYFRKKTSYIDNFAFRLHYRSGQNTLPSSGKLNEMIFLFRVTFGMLLICSLLATMSQFFGRPIQCLTSAAVPTSKEAKISIGVIPVRLCGGGSGG